MEKIDIRRLINKLGGHMAIGAIDHHGAFICIYKYKGYSLKLNYNPPTKKSMWFIFKGDVPRWDNDGLLCGHIESIKEYSSIEFYNLLKDEFIARVDSKFKKEKALIKRKSKKDEKEWLKNHRDYLKRKLDRF